MKNWIETKKIREMKISNIIHNEFNNVPLEIKTNVFKAKRWAISRLTELEGKGHYICISKESPKSNKIVCSFAKPQWPGDHCGIPCDTGAEAIVKSVLEYEHYTKF